MVEEELTHPTDRVFSIDFSDDSSILAVGSWDSNTYVYNTSNWSLQETLTDPTDRVRSVSFSSTGLYLAVAGNDETVYIYTKENSSWNLETTLENSVNAIYAVTFSSKESLIAYSSDNNDVYIHNTNTNGNGDWSLQTTFNTGTNIWDIEFSNNDELFAYGGLDKEVLVYNTIFGTSVNFEVFGEGVIDAGLTPSDTVSKALSELNTSTIDFSQHIGISQNYQEFEPSISESQKEIDVEFQVTGVSNSYGISSTDSIILTVTVTDQDAEISSGGTINLEGN